MHKTYAITHISEREYAASIDVAPTTEQQEKSLSDTGGVTSIETRNCMSNLVMNARNAQKHFNVRVEEVLHPNLTSTMWDTDKVCIDIVHMPKG